MQRPPRKLDAPLFGRSMVLSGLIQGLGILAVVAAIYIFALDRNLGEGEARMFAFVTLVIGNLGLIFANRSRTLSIFQSLRIPNKALWWVTGGALFFLVLVLTIPVLRDVFQFAPVHRWEMALLFVGGLSSILFAESVKLRAVQKVIYSEGER
jgi:Ca2+-transporting ATPase